jgi:hypothetical protein
MDELDAAVMVPSFLKAGRRVAIVELDLAWAFVNEMTVSPARPVRLTGFRPDWTSAGLGGGSSAGSRWWW